MFGVRADVDGVLFGLAARIRAHAMAGPGPFTKLRLVIQGLRLPLAIARSYRVMLWLLDIGIKTSELIQPYQAFPSGLQKN
jgi:hypothetical protein